MKLFRHVPTWTCVTINLAAFPGLGTILAGRRIGYLQAAVMVTGFVLTMWFMVYYIWCMAQYARGGLGTEAEFKTRYQPYLWTLYWGLGATALAWCWAAASSWQIWRNREQNSD